MRVRSTTNRIAGYAITGVSVLAVATALLTAGPARSQQVSLRMHTHVPPVAASFKNLKAWTEKVEKESGGKLKITLFGSNQLGGKAEDIYDQVKNGVVDIGWTLPGYKAALFPATGVFELPFIGGQASVVSGPVEDFIRKWGTKEWSEVRLLVLHYAGLSVLHMKDKPIRTIDDFKGMKIRTPSRISSFALTALGATPVPIPGLKVTEVLMRNVVDGAVIPWSISMAIRTIDVVKYHAETSLHGPTLALIMNKQSYEKLPADLKKVIDANSGRETAIAFGRKWEADDLPGRKKAIALGHEVYAISEEEEARWRKASQPAYETWIKDMDAKGLPGREMVADAERLVAKYKAAAKAKQ